MCSHGDTIILQLQGQPVDVDRCIAPLVQVLNDSGFPTVASCCGHGHRPGTIALRDGRELAILPNHQEARRLDPMWPDIHGEWVVGQFPLSPHRLDVGSQCLAPSTDYDASQGSPKGA